jgi:tetratricopeptide (TPR) repeat protein
MNTRLLLTLTALAACLAAPLRAQDAGAPAADLREYYDKAFGFYMAGDYARAIENWNIVLRADPKQITAKNMIEEARQKMSASSADLKTGFYSLVQKGRYSEALVRMEAMFASDPTNPVYDKLQARLRRISAAAPRKLAGSRAWEAAGAGITAWVNEKEDLSFAYDALRYARELAPGEKMLKNLAPSEKIFERLISLLEDESSQLRLNDTKPAASGVLDHKKELALRHIYDSKFYLAARELEGVLRLEPDDVTALKRAGSVYLQLKDYKQARRSWTRAAELSPEDEQLKQYLQALDQASPAAAGEKPAAPKPARKKRARR